MTDKNYDEMAHKYDGIKPIEGAKLYNVFVGQKYVAEGVCLSRAFEILEEETTEFDGDL
jgi:hypothetical protein